MIASVRGPVQHVGLDSVIVEVGGVGLLVHTTPGTAADLRRGSQATLATSLVVREESLTLYGFADADERALFEQVQTVSGVGPRLALAMLAVHPPDVLRGAISGGDLATLTKVPGIGKKGAERIVLELRDKVVAGEASPGTPARAAGREPWRSQVGEALVGLGWSAKQADDAVEAVAGQAGDGGDVSGLLRAALRELGR
ncbi:Holliday junction branch migration protein RuvA [Segeticoccus rhizosphaerae]|uniref:Holliday junction branch migration protein RuvA n=2 Tax=Segeticoccus rhizosphaerae TaxID=1104777 RepID=UPI0010BFC0CD|nr:Holliday junction branch migration protein RuvA [Ornithinicoccus soli]